MNADFPRVLTLLRKEKGVSQKSAAQELKISQALLSHYEKGIRECGLDFLTRCADYYGVSCDYLLGRSPDRKGLTITYEEIPEPEEAGRENRSLGSLLPMLNKKLVANTLNVLFDMLAKAKCKALTAEVSSFLMLACYRMFRVLHAANPKNQQRMFGIPAHMSDPYAAAAMQMAQANANAIATGRPMESLEPLADPSPLLISTELLQQNYPLFSSSLLNLVQNSEQRIGFDEREKAKK
jgi:transcriptional regulator with XRE-family HTH domain